MDRASIHPEVFMQLTLIAQRWEQGQTCEAPCELVRPEQLAVERLDERAARAFIVHHHYSKSFPAARLCVGLFRKQGLLLFELVGVAVLSHPCNEATLPAYLPGIHSVYGIELGRFVLLQKEPRNSESWFIARVFGQLRQALPDVRAVLSFSDPMPRSRLDGTVFMPGHVGTIYQATNGRYLGRSSARTILLAPDGRVLHNRSLSKLLRGERGADGVAQQLLDMGCRPKRPGESAQSWLGRIRAAGELRSRRHMGNHAYAWSLDRRDYALPQAFGPYPKKRDESPLLELMCA
jgi:hypothetical protein